MLGTPVPEVAGIGHSGRDPEARQDILLKNHPQRQEHDQQYQVFHSPPHSIGMMPNRHFYIYHIFR